MRLCEFDLKFSYKLRYTLCLRYAFCFVFLCFISFYFLFWIWKNSLRVIEICFIFFFRSLKFLKNSNLMASLSQCLVMQAVTKDGTYVCWRRGGRRGGGRGGGELRVAFRKNTIALWKCLPFYESILLDRWFCIWPLEIARPGTMFFIFVINCFIFESR